jgi:phage baseplate assembly protein W
MAPFEDLVKPESASIHRILPGERTELIEMIPQDGKVASVVKKATIMRIIRREPRSTIAVVHFDGDLPGTNFVRTIEEGSHV